MRILRGALLLASGLGACRPAGAPARTPTSCEEVIYVGDSTSRGMEVLGAELASRGVRGLVLDVEDARSMTNHYVGTPNAQEVVRARLAEGYAGCWVVAVGICDVGDSDGDVGDLDRRLRTTLDFLRGRRVLWTTVRLRFPPGSSATRRFADWNDLLKASCPAHPGLRVYDWAAELDDRDFVRDGVHYTPEGAARRARLTAEALGRAFPATGRSAHDCVVRTR